MALRNAITAIEWPEDELKGIATLRGPFFAFNDEVLLAFRQQINGQWPSHSSAPEPGASYRPVQHLSRRSSRSPTRWNCLRPPACGPQTAAPLQRPSRRYYKPCGRMPGSHSGRMASKRSRTANG